MDTYKDYIANLNRFGIYCIAEDDGILYYAVYARPEWRDLEERSFRKTFKGGREIRPGLVRTAVRLNEKPPNVEWEDFVKYIVPSQDCILFSDYVNCGATLNVWVFYVAGVVWNVTVPQIGNINMGKCPLSFKEATALPEWECGCCRISLQRD